MVSSDESATSHDEQECSEEEMLESSDESEEEAVRNQRPPTYWPIDKIIVKETEADGMPKEEKAKKRMRRLAGLIARRQIPITVQEFKSISKKEKHQLYKHYIKPFLEFPKPLRPRAKKKAMMMVAKSFRNFKSTLVSQYVAKGLEPFERFGFLHPEVWNEFVKQKSSDESKAQRNYYKSLREKNKLNHNLGTSGYNGKIQKWAEEDEKLEKEGIPNPWEEFPTGRTRNFLRARSKLSISGQAAEITWSNSATREVSENIKEKHADSIASGITWVREKDVLSACLGPEHPGRVRGLSSSKGWKHGWPEDIGIYRKRKRTCVDYDEMVAQVTRDVTEKLRKEFLAMLASQGGHITPFSRAPSPGAGQRSSCASAIEAGGANVVEDEDLVDFPQDTIDLLEGQPADCALIINPGGNQFEVARGRVHPEQQLLHCSPILDGHVAVSIEYVHFPFLKHKLDPPPNDEITCLEDALMQRIQWPRGQIIVNPPPMDSGIGPASGAVSRSVKSPQKGDQKSSTRELEME